MKTLSSVLIVLALLSAPPHAGATSGTCTITQLISDNNLNLPFDVSVAVGVAMPVEFDESAGTFAMKRDARPSAANGLGPPLIWISMLASCRPLSV